MGPPHSHGITRVPHYSGYTPYRQLSYTGLSPSLVGFPNTVLLSSDIHIAVLQPQTTEVVWFGLLPVRSPLLGKSLLFSLPEGT